GANGAGKTTTLRVAAGSLRPWRGKVEFEGEDVTMLNAHDKAARGMVMVPEGRQLFADMSVEENLEMGAFVQRARRQYKNNIERVFDYFPRLAERRRQMAGTLSGGEQQMLAMGRGLMASPKLLIIDELSLGLSPILCQQLFSTLRKLSQTGLSVLLVEQNAYLALALSNQAYVFANGKVEIEGPSFEVSQNPDVRKAYLGM
ncbi:Branched-chain amino acid transport ATP-binding protein LivF (TC 3.A.1.4.1), partial [hydrothermal vent metagenome]